MKELYATFVLPARNGCNLHCPYCVIEQRREARESRLSDGDYIRFFTDTLAELKVRRFSIQGFEPLLSETWPLTRELLHVAGAFFCESSLITNGTYLAEHAEELGGFPGLVDTITVSLDGDRAEVHDKLRRKSGCFDAALNGLQEAAHHFKGSLLVNSVLFPGKIDRLAGMPELLRQLGVKEWAISPYINVGRDVKVEHQRQLREDLLFLTDKARASGIKVYLSDELRRTEGSDLFKDFYVRSLGKGEGIFRLSPDGSCSRGHEILSEVGPAPIWDRAEAPAEFLCRIFAEKGQTIERRGRTARVLRRWRARGIFNE